MTNKKRPVIVSIIAFLNFVSGFILLGLGFGAVVLPQIQSFWDWLAVSSIGALIPVLQMLGMVFGTIVAVLGILGLILGYLVWTGHPWGYYLTLLGYGAGLGGGAVSSSPVGFAAMIIPAIIVLIWLNSDVQRFFGVKLKLGGKGSAQLKWGK